MRLLHLPLAVAVALSLLFLAGCAVNQARDLVSVGSAPRRDGLGRTILVCRVAVPGEAATEREKADRIVGLAEKAVETVPGVSRMASDTLEERVPGRPPMSLSDGELAGAALDAGADTVVLLDVLGYRGELTVSLLPPYWATGTDYAYHARVIDARTGRLYLDAHRGLARQGAFTAHTAAALDRDFAADLSALLGSIARGAGQGGS